MSNYSEFFLNSKSSVVQLELIAISHPNFTKTYYVVRNAINGITVKLETGVWQRFEYYPLQITPTGSNNDLDQTLQVQLGDLGLILPTELDVVNAANGFMTKPLLTYRTYRSDDLTAPLAGPFVFVINNIAFQKEGAVLAAGAPSLNLNRTGESYDMIRFPMLIGFI